METVEGLRDTARRARECAVIGQAVTLARWIGNGRRPVTAGRVLQKADVPAAGAALGVDVPPWLRTMADIRALHRPWCAAIATGLLQVGDGLRDAMVPGGTIAYTYDLGACWEHGITLEATVPRDPGQDYPVCVEFRGDSPVEYWCEDEPEEPEPFGLNEVNRRLAALNREPA